VELATAGVETGGAAHNRRFVRPACVVGEGVPDELVALAHDPQTSGGLLAAVPAAEVDDVTRALDTAGLQAWRVGSVLTGDPSVALI
jgi:selenide,water dikinase